MKTFESPRFYLDGVEKQNSADSHGLHAIYRKNFKDEEEGKTNSNSQLDFAKKSIIVKHTAE